MAGPGAKRPPDLPLNFGIGDSPHRGGTVRLRWSINGHGDIGPTGATNTSLCFWSRASFWLLILLLFFVLLLLFCVLFLTLLLILLALVSHFASLLPVVLHVLAMRARLRRQSWLGALSRTFLFGLSGLGERTPGYPIRNSLYPYVLTL
jgi:hypothetical protein